MPWRRPLLVCAAVLSASGVLASLPTAPAQAESITAESIWDKRNAIQRAQSQLPQGATVTRTECMEVNVRTGNYRYICTLDYVMTPANPTPASPNAPSAPAP